MKTKAEFAARRDELKSMLQELETKVEAARQAWRKSSYRDDESYRQYDRLTREQNDMKWELNFYTMLADDKPLYCNERFYTDVEPWEVLEVRTDRKLIVRAMKSVIKPEAKKALADSFVPGGFCGHTDNELQEWEITQDTDGAVQEVRLHKDGCFYGKTGGKFILQQEPRKYFDYNF